MLIAFGIILGAMIGSFIATAVIRGPNSASILYGRSHCDGCGEVVTLGKLVPVFSYVIQSGSARCCRHPIDTLHLLSECAAALIGGVCFFLFGLEGWPAALLGWALLALALFDLRYFVLPDGVNAVLLVSGLMVGIIQGSHVQDRLIAIAGGYAILSGIGWTYQRVRQREGLGGGDPKLLAAIGAWLGWQPLALLMACAASIGLAVLLVMRARGQAVTAITRLPLGTLMAAAAWPIYVMLALEGQL